MQPISDIWLMDLTLTFHCEYCDEELGTELRHGGVYHEEFHECFGESIGYIAEVGSGEMIMPVEDIYVKVEET